MKILTVPNPLLTKKSTKVDKIDKKLLKIVRQLKEVLRGQKTPHGLGLSAVQIGILKRVFLAKIGGKIQVFINPQIVWRSPRKTRGGTKENPFLEGCLSIPNYYGIVWRAEKVQIRFTNLEGKKEELKLENLEARVVQHEYDHLEGILFTQRVLEQKEKLYKLVKKGKRKELKEVDL